MFRGRFSQDEARNRTRVNLMIRITPIRLIGPDNEQIGVVETAQALRMAQEAGLDLVEIVPDQRPPVCKIMDYGKFKYDESKKKAKQTNAPEMKEVRLGKSVKIDEHDLGIRINQARHFLIDGHKVLFTQRFKGREIAHRELGLLNLAKVRDALADIGKVEQPPRWEGKAASIIIAPDRAKVDAIRRKLDKERAEKLGVEHKPQDEREDREEREARPAREPRDAAQISPAVPAAAPAPGSPDGAATPPAAEPARPVIQGPRPATISGPRQVTP